MLLSDLARIAEHEINCLLNVMNLSDLFFGHMTHDKIELITDILQARTRGWLCLIHISNACKINQPYRLSYPSFCGWPE